VAGSAHVDIPGERREECHGGGAEDERSPLAREQRRLPVPAANGGGVKGLVAVSESEEEEGEEDVAGGTEAGRAGDAQGVDVDWEKLQAQVDKEIACKQALRRPPPGMPASALPHRPDGGSHSPGGGAAVEGGGRKHEDTGCGSEDQQPGRAQAVGGGGGAGGDGDGDGVAAEVDDYSDEAFARKQVCARAWQAALDPTLKPQTPNPNP
jgi:hypothetical protein